MTAKHDEEIVMLPDGMRVRLRPIRADDAAGLQDFVMHRMAPEDLRLRFFAPIHELSPGLLNRLTHPDPVREVAIVVEPEEAPEIIAIGRLAADAGSRSAEYAVTVRTDLKGHGIGYMLMGRLVETARRLGYDEMFGLVLRENERMLQIAAEHGFALADDPADAAVIRVARQLS